jgi:hypothetical protein
MSNKPLNVVERLSVPCSNDRVRDRVTSSAPSDQLTSFNARRIALWSVLSDELALTAEQEQGSVTDRSARMWWDVVEVVGKGIGFAVLLVSLALPSFRAMPAPASPSAQKGNSNSRFPNA